MPLRVLYALWITLVVLALLAGVAFAGPVTLVWDADPAATSTEIEQMVCAGTHPNFVCGAWATVKTVQHSAACRLVGSATSPDITCETPYTAPAGLVLFAFKQMNANGVTTRRSEGGFHNEAWIGPGIAKNVGTR